MWRGAVSPLFGKDKMTTLERYFVEDKDTHKEVENSYFSYRTSEKVLQLILEEFGLSSKESRMVNGHTPVKTVKGESPIRGGWFAFLSLTVAFVKLIKRRQVQQAIPY